MTPIVLAHGLLGYGKIRIGDYTLLAYFRGIEANLRRLGASVIVPAVSMMGSVRRRAEELFRAIEEATTDPVSIVAHSMGGLDARWLAARIAPPGRIKAVVTIGTPHRGSPLADLGVPFFGERLGGFRLMEYFGVDAEGFRDLMTASMARFNGEVEDAPGTAYFSISGGAPPAEMSAYLPPLGLYLQKTEGENDGLVSVASAKWGTHLGTWPCDHFHEIRWDPTRDEPRPLRAGEPPGYGGIVEMLGGF